MSAWDDYPETYRKIEVDYIIKAINSGENVAVVGLSGSGKSNLLGFISHRSKSIPIIAIDCNQITETSSQEVFHLLRKNILIGEKINSEKNELNLLEATLQFYFETGKRLAFFMDRFDFLMELKDFDLLAGNLRSLRDAYKYRLSFVIAMRRPLDLCNEFSELFFGHTIWLGPLVESDARWSVYRDLNRMMPEGWDESCVDDLIKLTRGYPSLLRAVCEAVAAGVTPSFGNICQFPSVVKRVTEFWIDNPSPRDLELSGLKDLALLKFFAEKSSGFDPHSGKMVDRTQLTLKENLLFEYLINHIGQVCDKDALIRAIWPEDVIFEKGVRDENLAQLVRRLRTKIEHDPSQALFIQTIPGRGYLFKRNHDL